MSTPLPLESWERGFAAGKAQSQQEIDRLTAALKDAERERDELERQLRNYLNVTYTEEGTELVLADLRKSKRERDDLAVALGDLNERIGLPRTATLYDFLAQIIASEGARKQARDALQEPAHEGAEAGE